MTRVIYVLGLEPQWVGVIEKRMWKCRRDP